MSDPTPAPHNQEAEVSKTANSEIERIEKFEQLASIHQMLADFTEWAKEQEANGKEAEEMHEKMYYSKLPEALFHATTPAKAKRIMLEGLKPHQLEFEPDVVVSLSDTITFAKFCAGVTQETPEDDLVVLEITTRGLDRAQARSFLQLPNKVLPNEPMHEVHYYEPINADWIHSLTSDEIAEIEKEEK